MKTLVLRIFLQVKKLESLSINSQTILKNKKVKKYNKKKKKKIENNDNRKLRRAYSPFANW